MRMRQTKKWSPFPRPSQGPLEVEAPHVDLLLLCRSTDWDRRSTVGLLLLPPSIDSSLCVFSLRGRLHTAVFLRTGCWWPLITMITLLRLHSASVEWSLCSLKLHSTHTYTQWKWRRRKTQGRNNGLVHAVARKGKLTLEENGVEQTMQLKLHSKLPKRKKGLLIIEVRFSHRLARWCTPPPNTHARMPSK